MIDPDPTPTIMRAQRAEEHLKVDERLMSLLDTYHAIVLKDDDFAEKLTWCLENCQNKFRVKNKSLSTKYFEFKRARRLVERYS